MNGGAHDIATPGTVILVLAVAEHFELIQVIAMSAELSVSEKMACKYTVRPLLCC